MSEGLIYILFLIYLIFTVVQNCDLPVRKLFSFVQPLEISEMLLCLMSTLNVATVLHLGS